MPLVIDSDSMWHIRMISELLLNDKRIYAESHWQGPKLYLTFL